MFDFCKKVLALKHSKYIQEFKTEFGVKMSTPTKKLEDGTEIPAIGLGTWELEDCAEIVKLAIELGYRHIDTAQVYENHLEVGEGIKGFPREELFIASKLQWDFLEPELVTINVDKAIHELGCDYLDLFMIHWPNNEKKLSKIVETLLNLKEKGKILNVGVCNFTRHHLQDLLDDGLKVCLNQVEFHPFFHEKGLLDFCHKNHMEMTAYCPLAHGKVFQNLTLSKIAEKYGRTVSQICLRWLLQQNLIVIPKGHSKLHLQENLEVFDFTLSSEDMDAISLLNTNKREVEPPIHEFDY